jgi:hypothetical protein
VADDQTFEVLLKEFRRVGVDPDTFSAMLALRPEEALRALRVLPDGAGPSAFLSQLRKNGHSSAVESAETPQVKRDRHRQDKSA